MSAGLQQMVKVTEWQLSHGSETDVASPNAMLQRSDLVVFDESFASHDSETLLRTLDSVLRRATTLPITSHPG